MSLNEENGASSTVFDAGLELIKADFHLHTQKDKEFSYTGEQNDFVNDIFLLNFDIIRCFYY